MSLRYAVMWRLSAGCSAPFGVVPRSRRWNQLRFTCGDWSDGCCRVLWADGQSSGVCAWWASGDGGRHEWIFRMRRSPPRLRRGNRSGGRSPHALGGAGPTTSPQSTPLTRTRRTIRPHNSVDRSPPVGGRTGYHTQPSHRLSGTRTPRSHNGPRTTTEAHPGTVTSHQQPTTTQLRHPPTHHHQTQPQGQPDQSQRRIDTTSRHQNG